jgi:hypothetical protein
MTKIGAIKFFHKVAEHSITALEYFDCYSELLFEGPHVTLGELLGRRFLNSACRD